MIRSTSRRRLVAIVVGVTGLAVTGLLAGCGTGQVAETADIVPAVPGANLDLRVDGGLLSVRDATVDYPGPEGYRAGGHAALTIRIINGTTSPVRLTGATARAAIANTSIGTVLQVGGTPTGAPTVEAPVPATPTRNPTPAAKTSRPGTAAASPTRPASPSEPASPASPAPIGNSSIDVSIPAAPDGLIILSRANTGGTYLVIDGLTQALAPGSSIQLTLTFTLADGSTVQLGNSNLPSQKLAVPVAVPLSPAPRSALSLSPAG